MITFPAITALVLLAQAQPPAPAALDTTTLRATPRTPIGVLLVLPDRVRGRVGVADLHLELERVLHDATALTPRLVDVDVRDCVGAIACMCDRADHEVVAMSAELLLVIGVRAEEGQPDLLLPLLVDATRARQIAADAKGDAEAALESGAVLARPPSVTVSGIEALPTALRGIVAALEPALAPRGVWATLGTIDVEAEAGHDVSIDETALGLTAARTIIRDVATGTRTITVGSHTTTVLVRSGTVAHVRLGDVTGASAGPASTVQTTGLVLAAAGVAATVVGLVTREPNGAVTCALSGPTQATCVPDTFDRIDGAGPLMIPLGYSLVAAGAAMFLGVESEALDPWWWALIGVGLGAATYTLSEVAN